MTEIELRAARLKALAHPQRLAILEILALRGTCICGELVDELPIAQATVSQHLKILKEAGFVRGTIDGPRSCYCLDPAIIASFRTELDAWLAGIARCRWQSRPDPRGDTCMSEEARLHELVRERYGAVARTATSCCGPSSCGSDSASIGANLIGDAYRGVEGHVPEADLALGCGVPTRHAGIREGDTVLDLGSGAGNDVFVARRLVGASGQVVGVDMTPEMIARARANAARLGYANVEFREGQIEALPVADASVDVVISNCVLNLVPDKARAFAEIFRVLRPGGRFCISDIVATAELPPEVAEVAALYVGCIAGALPEAHYLAVVQEAGFADMTVAERKPVHLDDEMLGPHLSQEAIRRFRSSGVGLASITLVAVRPHAA